MGEEYAKYKYRKAFRKKLEAVFLQTKYESMIGQIMTLMNENKLNQKKTLYLGVLKALAEKMEE